MPDFTPIRIHRHDDTIRVETPYHPDLPAMFGQLGGRWSGDTWDFDRRDEDTVRAICRDVFGTDGIDTPPLVTLRLHFHTDVTEWHAGVFLAGRCIARAYGRDSGAKLGPGVVVVDGSKPRSGGSVKNWRTVIPEDSILEVRDVPKPAADRLLAETQDAISVEVVAEQHPEAAALLARRDQLRAELDEVETLIASLGEEAPHE